MSRHVKPSIDSLLAELSTLKDRVAELARVGAADALASAANGVSHAGSAVTDTADEALTSVRDAILNRPIVSLVGAFALGLALAGLLKR
jgi:hypothetical protein